MNFVLTEVKSVTLTDLYIKNLQAWKKFMSKTNNQNIMNLTKYEPPLIPIFDEVPKNKILFGTCYGSDNLRKRAYVFVPGNLYDDTKVKLYSFGMKSNNWRSAYNPFGFLGEETEDYMLLKEDLPEDLITSGIWDVVKIREVAGRNGEQGYIYDFIKDIIGISLNSERKNNVVYKLEKYSIVSCDPATNNLTITRKKIRISKTITIPVKDVRIFGTEEEADLFIKSVPEAWERAKKEEIRVNNMISNRFARIDMKKITSYLNKRCPQRNLGYYGAIEKYITTCEVTGKLTDPQRPGLVKIFFTNGREEIVHSSYLLEMTKKEWDILKEEESRDRIKKMLADRIAKKIKEDLQQNTQDISKLMAVIVSKMRDRNNLGKRLESSDLEALEPFYKSIEELKKYDNVASVRLDSNLVLEIITKDFKLLTSRDKSLKKYLPINVGSFIIHVDIINLNFSAKHYQKMPYVILNTHPHCSTSNSLCIGNFRDKTVQALAVLDILPVMDTIFAVLENWNENAYGYEKYINEETLKEYLKSHKDTKTKDGIEKKPRFKKKINTSEASSSTISSYEYSVGAGGDFQAAPLSRESLRMAQEMIRQQVQR